jgi:hypothetical protein
MQGTNWFNVADVAQQCAEDMATKEYTRRFLGGCVVVVGNPKHNSRRLTLAVQNDTAEFVRYGVSIDSIYAALLEAQAYFKAQV